MDPEEFNEMYSKRVHDYAFPKTLNKSNISKVVGVCYGDVCHWFHESWNNVMCVNPAMQYRIHPSIVELLEIKYITKMHASPINIGIGDGFMRWNISIIEIFGVPVVNHKNLFCMRCETQISMYGGKWIHADRNALCLACHGPTDNNYKYYHPCNFCVTDWVEFANSGYCKFYTDCNLYSDTYGKVAFGRFRNFGYVLSMLSVDELLDYIQQWIDVTPVTTPGLDQDMELYESPNKQLDSWLNTNIAADPITYRARDLGILGKDELLTYQSLIEIHQIVSPNTAKENEDSIVANFREASMYTEYGLRSFPDWLNTQLGKIDFFLPIK